MKKFKLFLAAMAALVTMGVQAQSWTGNEPAEGTFFLYNVGAAKFINNGDVKEEWGTNAYLQAGFGLDFILEAAGENAYNLNTNVSNGGNSHYLATSTWCDGGPTAWTFTVVEGQEKTYTISNGSSYLVSNDALNDIVYGASTGDSKSYWKLVSLDDFKAAMQAKVFSATNPMDVSIFIQGRSFARNDSRNNTWNKSNSGGNFRWVENSGNNCQYQGNEAWNCTFDVNQTITGLPDGTYEVQCSGFGTNGTTIIYGNTTEGILTTDNSAANGNSGVAYRLIATENAWAGQTTGTFALSGGSLKVGIKRTTNKSGDWAVFDEFRLYYYGLDLSEFASELAKAVAAAEAVTEGTIPTAAYNALVAVVTENNKTYTTVDEYSAATNAIIEATNKALGMKDNFARYNNVKTAVLAIAENANTSTADSQIAAATSNEEINTAIATLRSAFLAELPNVAIPAEGYIDVTAAMVDNASVSTNINYWTAEEIPGKGKTGGSWGVCNFGECEFYNQNFKFYQTLSLSKGTWEFGVTGFHRAGNHKTHFYAGVDNILIPGVESSVVNTMAEAKTYFDNGNGKVSLKFGLEAADNIEIGIINEDTETDKWTIFRDFTLKYYGASVDYSAYITRWNNAVSAANTAKNDVNNKNVTGSELVALNAALADEPDGSSKANYIAKIDALTEATSAFIAAAPSYDGLVAEIEKAKALGMATETVESFAATSSTTAAKAVTNTQDLMVAEYNYVIDNFTTPIELGDWAQEGGTTFNYGGQHWSGDTSLGYWEQTNENYGKDSWNISFNQTIELPAGDYIFKVAGRHSGGTNMALVVKDVTDDENPQNLGSVNDFPATGVGKGISTDGKTNFTDGTFAKNGEGYGFQWRYVAFTLTATKSINIAVTASANSKYQWVSFCNYEVLAVPSVAASRIALQQTIDGAPEVRTNNVGTDVFQYPASVILPYSEALNAAITEVANPNATIASLDLANANLKSTMENYIANSTILNAPDASKRYVLTIRNTEFDGNAITFIAGARANQGGYGIKYLAPINQNLSQAVKFTAVEGNKYKVSILTATGTEQYITTAKLAYNTGDNRQIRTTDDASKALEIEIKGSDTDGLFWLYNTAADADIANNGNNDVYTSGSALFSIAEASKAEIAINTKAAGWGTIILPFGGLEVPLGQKAYSCEEVNESTSTLILNEVSVLEANTPYILQGDWEQTPTGWGLAGALTYTDGLLTGVYAKTTAPGGSYVLQNQGGKVGFYMVDLDYLEANEMSVPNVPANRAYLEVPAAGVKAFYFGDVETAIKSVFDGVAAGEVYDLNGRKVGSMQKGGAYIVNGKKVIIK